MEDYCQNKYGNFLRKGSKTAFKKGFVHYH